MYLFHKAFIIKYNYYGSKNVNIQLRLNDGLHFLEMEVMSGVRKTSDQLKRPQI